MVETSTEKRQKVRRKYFLQKPIDGQAVKNLTIAGLTWLKTNQQTVNALNVFPVPDGDTGTNMVLTMQSAVDEIEKSPERNTGNMLRSFAQGALMGARGNSGVILSQLWRGFSRALDKQETLTAEGLVNGFAEARDTAYKGVARPVEGTILTVAKDIASATKKALKKTKDPIKILEEAVSAAEVSVENTPELLPVLKEAGVVDSGGRGLYFILEGMVRWVNGEPLETALYSVQPLAIMNLENSLDSMEEGQDYEVVVDFQPNGTLDLEDYYGGLEEMGTSIQVGEGDGMYRMHIHVPTEKRYEPIDYTMSKGTITNVVIENLMAQMDEIEKHAGESTSLVLDPVEAGQIAVVTVVPGTGIARVFASLGVAAIVEGGQSMNPSINHILSSFENLPTNNIIILPNNKNIMMAAEQAADLTVKNVKVIKSHTIPQGLAAMLRLNPAGDLEKVEKEMTEALNDVETGEITTSTRNVEIDGVEVNEGEIIALLNGKLILSAPNLKEGCLGLLKKAKAKDYELITLFYGSNIEKNEVTSITEAIKTAFPDQELEIQEGDQPHYQFIFSIE